MKISKDYLIPQIKLYLPGAQRTHDSQVEQEKAQELIIAKPVKDRIPRLIAEAVAARRSYAEVCDIHSFQAVGSNPSFLADPANEKLYFEFRGVWIWDYQTPKPEWLFGASEIVYAYCVENDLRPKLLPYHEHSMPGNKDIWWSASKLIIRWQPEHMNKLLGITE
ncbi:MAG: hypothetical protein P4L53_03975 [Candidatus Obscuribacterales bacterium]|nr:hypothetical protein [Candidatus Obscuribacterales bacterium]